MATVRVIALFRATAKKHAFMVWSIKCLNLSFGKLQTHGLSKKEKLRVSRLFPEERQRDVYGISISKYNTFVIKYRFKHIFLNTSVPFFLLWTGLFKVVSVLKPFG